VISGSRVALALMLVVALAQLAAAGPSAAERAARHSFQNAESHFRAGRFAEALAEYQAGYDKAPLPGFLINIAQCHRRLGDLRKARATYHKFVMVAPDSPHVPEVRSLIAELDKLVADLDGQKAAEAARRQDVPEPASVAPVAAPATMEPASAPAAAKPPVPAAPPPAAAAAEEIPVLVATPQPADEPATAPRKSRWWLWTAIGVAVAGGTATAFLVTRSPETTTVHEGTLGTLRR
jgi:hypothetical protein